MQTTEPPVQPPPSDPGPEAAPEARRWSPRRRWITSTAVVAVLGLLAAAVFVRLPYYTLSPGSVRQTEQVISVKGAPSYSPAGAVNFLTVSVKQATPLDIVNAWLDPSVDVWTAKQFLGDSTPQQNQAQNLQMMTDSKDTATYQALTRLGYDVGTTGTGAVIAGFADGDIPAKQVLKQGDTIVEADGTPIQMNQQLVDVISTKAPGDTIRLGVQPLAGGETRIVTTTLVSRPGDPKAPMLGVSTFTRDLKFQFPVDVRIDTGSIGGPSAGLALTLGILDVMTPKSLTGGKAVATTGTMSLDGTVGPVGGVHQKVEAAKKAGVSLLLVPKDEYAEAERYAGNLRVEPVATLDDALAALATIGGGDAVLPPKPAPKPIG